MDRQTAKALYEEHAPIVLRYLLKTVRSEEIAEDLLQDVFLRFLKHGNPKKIRNIRSYLFRIAHNLYADYVANQVRHENAAEILQQNERHADFTEGILWKNLRMRILDNLRRKNPGYAEVFLLRVDEDLTYPEIAYVLGVSERTIIRHFEDIRNILKQEFREELDL